jgi:hypothetical protein
LLLLLLLLSFKRRFGLGFLYSKWSIKWNIFYIKKRYSSEMCCKIKKEKVHGWPVFKAAMNHCSRRFNNLKMQFFSPFLYK